MSETDVARNLGDCKDACNAEFKTCKTTESKKQCKKVKKGCKKECGAEADAATLCVPCEDNDIGGLGTEWCVTNLASETFCDVSAWAKKYCKKTCDLCD